MLNKYFPNNNGKECIRSSLANLLVELNEPSLAKFIFNNYRKHELVEEDGNLNGALLPRVMRDLTSNQYSGILYGDLDSNLDLEKKLKEFFPQKWELKLKAILESKLRGKIKPASLTNTHSLPVMYLIKMKNSPSNREQGHALVRAGLFTYINDGNVIHCDSNYLPLIGVFKPTKNYS